LQSGRPPVTLGQTIIARVGATTRRAVSTGERVGSQAIGLVAEGNEIIFLPPRHPDVFGSIRVIHRQGWPSGLYRMNTMRLPLGG
jgi:hypothetical protein